MGGDKHQRKRKQKETEEDILLEFWRLIELSRDFVLKVGLEAGTWIHVSLLC